MIRPHTNRDCSNSRLTLEDFVRDSARPRPGTGAGRPTDDCGLIEGVVATPLYSADDERGSLFELLTIRDGPIEPIVHVYQVFAAPRSIRAWVYHCHQVDRLAFTMGSFDVALYDLRPSSRTAGRLNVFALGAARPALLHIPAYVAHGVRNTSIHTSAFLNLPTRAYQHDAPDKVRLPYDDPRMPSCFDD